MWVGSFCFGVVFVSVYIKKDRKVCCIDKVLFFFMSIIFVVYKFFEFDVFFLGENINFVGF